MVVPVQKYKCSRCFHVVETDVCPHCGQMNLKKMCARDHCNCTHDVIPSVAYCPDCGEGMCPICGSHDVNQISRVTGYMSDVTGWNAGKRQELLDRKKYNLI